MNLRVANADDLTSVLDRILDKGIVLDCWVRVMPEQVEPLLADSAVSLVSSSVYVGYASIGAWQEHRDWTSCLLSGNAISGLNNAVLKTKSNEDLAVDFPIKWSYSAFTRERRAIQHI